jgi:uncharacterized protein (TIGR01244 family)
MNSIHAVTADFAVAGALTPEDFARVAAQGFKTVINFRPDGEAVDQMPAAEGRALALSHGLAYLHIPANKYDVFTDPVVDAGEFALKSNEGPVLAHCASGQRALIIWAAAQARSEPVGQVLQTLAAAGANFAFLRDDLDAQADRARWRGQQPAAAANMPTPEMASA